MTSPSPSTEKGTGRPSADSKSDTTPPPGRSIHTPKLRVAPFSLQSSFPFTVFFAVNFLAALYAPIQDCDEVFNFWEPTHYLNHRFGLQTWEYAPEYSIRSWLYIVIHAMIGKVGSLLSSNKAFEFYMVRTVLAIACAASETCLYSAISRTLNPRIGIMFMMAMVFSPGMFHASVALLPSSFSMYTAMLGTAAFMDWRGGLKTHLGIMWFGIGAIVGWPFSAALVVPLVMEDVFLAYLSMDRSEAAFRYIDGFARSLIVLALQVCIDAFFYHKLVVVPWRIVMYNIFSGSSRGPDIFGTEPWHFYFRNLSLNFNLWFLLAAAAGPLVGAELLLRNRTSAKRTSIRSLVFVSPFYLWLTIFSVQPHKEERFMYPIYPLLSLNAAIALHTLLSYFGTADPRTLMGKIPAKIKLAVVSTFIISAIGVGTLRTIGIVAAYRAPLQVYAPLRRPEFIGSEQTICLGKEWYRFPSSYFLPSGMRAKFVKSAFDGLLPGEFSEAKVGFGFFPGSWLDPSGMNDQNVEDPGKYTDIDHCTFLVDSYFPGAQTSSVEPNHILDTDTWEELQCSNFLDTRHTHLLGRTLWIPDVDMIPVEFRRKWGRYCLLRRKQHS